MISVPNLQPVSYLQFDSRWKSHPYAVAGETSTIGSAGCGPTSAAMLISTLTGKTVTPVDTCLWSLKHGYKALNQGTYYSYFVPQFAVYDLDCRQLNSARLLNAPNSPVHDEAEELLKKGYYLIALMGPGTWTKSGHFIVVWWADGVYYINDPASTKTIRLRGNIHDFRSQCRVYWAIDARNHNQSEEEEDMDFSKLTDAEVDALIVRLNKRTAAQPVSDYAKEACQNGVKAGLFSDGNSDGMVDNPQGFLRRQELAVVLDRAKKILGK